MQIFHLHARRRRARGAAAILVIVFALLCAAFFNTQVVENSAYTLQSDQNRLRPLPIPAARGTIYDRAGRVVAGNQPGYALALLPAPEDTMRRALQEIAPLLGLSDARMRALLARHREERTRPLIVTPNLTFEQASSIEEQLFAYPRVLIDMRPKRSYPAGKAIAHLIGYVSEISRSELERPEFAAYTQGQIVGKAGLERQFERRVGGRPGIRYVEVDARGRIVSGLEARALPTVPPVAGQPLKLQLDLELQQFVSRIFPDSMRGAVVAMEPGSGHILAAYSNPSFDPNLFVGGISSTVWNQLNTDAAKPLLDRSTIGLYPPGSTFKLATAAIALELNAVDPEAFFPIPCRGGMQYGNRYFRCWERKGHGYLDLADAIKHSCDVYFYQLGLKIGLDRLLAEGTRLGFSKKSGVDLPIERAGNFPDEPDWFRRRFGWKPTQAEVLSLAIGQGPNDQTPLKMAQFYAALAANGRVGPPRLANVPGDTAGGWDLHLSQESLKWLREGLRRVTAPGGTAGMSALEHWDWIGKTGTSQNPHGDDHAWFVGMAGPRDGAPEVVVAALIEFGEHGSEAAQYAAKTADYYLRRRHGMKTDTIQTLREYLIAGRPTNWVKWQ
ncbi:MAG: penicillin-binding protein 2 [Gemmatimonadota bacterium]